MTAAGIILARMDSSRFPGKALTRVGDCSLLETCLSGVSKSSSFRPILATSDRSVDQPLADLAAELGVPCHRGPVDDVYGRVCGCLERFGVEVFARINGDSPFVQAALLEEGLVLLRESGCDFVTNLLPRRYPYGVSVEIFRSDLFLRCADDLTMPDQREHITSFFYQNLDRFDYRALIGGSDRSDIRLTIDTPEDLFLIQKMLDHRPDLFDLPLTEIIRGYRRLFNSENLHSEVKP